MHRQLLLALATAVFAACGSVARPVAPGADVSAEQLEYLWIPLDVRGDGFQSSARAINNRNQVVGVASTTQGQAEPSHAFLWENGVMQDLGTLGGTHSEARAINDRGQVVGWSTAADGSTHAFFWADGAMQDLGPVDLTFLGIFGLYPAIWSPVHINEQGQVVGNRPEGGAFLWEDGVTQALPLDFAAAINNAGQVVGWVMMADTDGVLRRRAALWADGVVTDLGTLGGDESGAVAISNSGWVAGTSRTEPREFMGTWTSLILPFRWRDGIMDDLGRPGNESTWLAQFVSNEGQVVAIHPPFSGTFVWDQGAWQGIQSTWAFAMNGQGAITGAKGSLGNGHAFVWQDGVMRDLGTGLGSYSRGHAINEEGVVAGHTGVPSSYQAAAVWVPVPDVVALVP